MEEMQTAMNDEFDDRDTAQYENAFSILKSSIETLNYSTKVMLDRVHIA